MIENSSRIDIHEIGQNEFEVATSAISTIRNLILRRDSGEDDDVCERKRFEISKIVADLSFATGEEARFFVEELFEIFRDFDISHKISNLNAPEWLAKRDFFLGEDYVVSLLVKKIGADVNFREQIGSETLSVIWVELSNRYYGRLREKGETDGPLVGSISSSSGVGEVWENISDDFDDCLAQDEMIMLNKLIQHIAPYTADKKVVDRIVEFIRVFRDQITKYAADALSGIDAQYSAGKMLGAIKDERHKGVKEDLTRVLYRIELGQMPISDQGVEYLGRLYDLGEKNNPGYFARRLTADGDVGIFDEQSHLSGYFQLGDLTSGVKKVKARVFEFVYETLFVGNPNESAKDRQERMKYLSEFQNSYFEILNDKIFKETGVHFNNLSFKEQGWFLIYYQNATEQEKHRLKEFLYKFGEGGIKTFFALESDESSGEDILSIGEKTDQVSAHHIFDKFNEIGEIVREIQKSVAEKFGADVEFSQDDLSYIASDVLQRGRNLLRKFAELSRGSEALDKRDGAKIVRELNHIRADVVLFAVSFSRAIEGRGVELQDIKGVSFESKDSSELSEEEREEMSRIFVQNRPGYSPILLSKTKEEFESAMDSEGKRFYVVRHDGDIIAFARFDDKGNNTKYAGSFNVRPEARGASIGSSFLRTVVAQEGVLNTLEAVVYSKNPMLNHYVEDFGFQITGEVENYEDTGETYYKLVRPPQVVKINSRQSSVRSDRRGGSVSDADGGIVEKAA
jgi:ribosomal protein S18 acetylase RimI-like enzyme